MSSNLFLIPFNDNEGRFQGDTFLPVNIYIPFHENSSKINVRKDILKAIKNYYEPDNSVSLEEFINESGFENDDITGCWVINYDILKGILSTLTSSGCDAEEYSKIESVKMAINESSEKILNLI